MMIVRERSGLGHGYAVMLPVFVYTRTSAPAKFGANQIDTPSNAPPWYPCETPAGHPLKAVMPPEVMLMRSIASALCGTSHTDCPSNTPPAKVFFS